MDDQTGTESFDARLSGSTFSSAFNVNDNEENEIDDPISAYFKRRCRKSSQFSFMKRQSDSDSSVGVIDVDSISLFDKDEEVDDMRLSQNLLEQFREQCANKNENQKHSVASLYGIQSQIEKQRALAQEALMKVKNNDMDNQCDFLLTPEQSRENNAQDEISSKVNNAKQSTGNNVTKNWFKPNFSLDTPRLFNDELSSLGDENSLESKNETTPKNISQTHESQYAKQVNILLKELSQVHLNPDMEFKSFTKEEKINRLEEDEKAFKLEKAGVLHNSRISQFSGIIGDDATEWPDSSNTLKPEAGKKNLSIGQFFTLRSNSISSLVGSATKENLTGELPKLTESESQSILKNEYSLPICDSSSQEKKNLRRCASSFDLKRIPDNPKPSRHSNDSCSSNSTVMIQNILAEMDSGLSGTQIYEKLMKSYGKKQIPEKEKKNNLEKIVESSETPKSSKVPSKKEMAKLNRKENFERDLNKELKKSNVKNSPKPKFFSDDDFKENKPVTKKSPLEKNEKIKKLKSKKGFDASTPKLQVLKSQNDKFKTACSKVLMVAEDWEAPRISAIQPTIELSKSGLSDENEKTITANSTVNSADQTKKNSSVSNVETITVEDAIAAGDLTIVSQRINEMKEEGTCIIRSKEAEEPVLFTVIEKLDDLPIGSTDCSALISLLQDQFPELLSTIPTPKKDKRLSNALHRQSTDKILDVPVPEPGSWIKLPKIMGLTEKIFACTEVEKIIHIPLTNTSKNWLLVTIESLTLIHPSGKKLHGIKKNNEWDIFDFVTISMKETLVPPESQQSLKVFYTPKIPTTLDINLVFTLKQLLKKDFQSRSVRIRAHNINPLHSINITPTNLINFGIIDHQCFDSSVVQVTFDGFCELPLIIYLEEEDCQSQQFYLAAVGKNAENEWKGKKYHHAFHAGEKQILEFRVCFQPKTISEGESKTQDFKATLMFKLGTKTESDGILQKIQVKGSVGVAKFYISPSSSPLVFRATEKGQSVTRPCQMKNVGSLPIAFSVKIVNKDFTEAEDNLFVAPKTFYLSKNEESAIDVTFNSTGFENYVKRLLWLQVTPNGRVNYEIDLIGFTASTESRPLSRMSEGSGSTKSATNPEPKPIKLLTTTQTLGWTAVALEKEVTLSFQLKNISNTTMSARISFMKNMDSFKFIHENGEKIQKMRKHLKPDCPCTVTVSFRPDFIGGHHNSVFIEMSQNTKKAISLSGIGGLPNIFLANVKSDLNGCKILRLQNYSSDNKSFSNTLEFKNQGRIPGFISIEPTMEVPSIRYGLSITPNSCVIAPNSTVVVKVTQILKSENLKFLLTEKDISKLATLSVIIGDEPSRLRLRKLVKNGSVGASRLIKSLTSTFNEEVDMNLKLFEDSPGFEKEFLKSLKLVEVPVVVERSPGACEPSILEDPDDTHQEFVTIISAVDNTIVSPISYENEIQSHSSRQKAKSNDGDLTLLSAESASSQSRITKWLETLECQ